MRESRFLFAVLIVILSLAAGVLGQTTQEPNGPPSKQKPSQQPPPDRDPDNPYPASDVPSKLLINLAIDQKDIWTSPFRARVQDLNWILPVSGLTAGFI